MNYGYSCKECHYWNSPKGENVGECVRYPPSVAGLTQEKGPLGRVKTTPIFCFPQTMEGHWCGEFRLKTSIVTS